MNYYKRHLGDYAKKTGRLTMLQHGAYTLLIDSCYDREKFPTLEDAIEWTWASSKEEIEAVEFILKRFFEEKEGVFFQKRIQEEVEKYHVNAEINSRIATEREAKRTERAKASTVEHEPPPNHKPLTNNHKPNTNKPPSVSDEVWDSFVKHRKTKKALVTDLVIRQIGSEAEKVGWSMEDALAEVVNRGWTSFKADWVKGKDSGSDYDKLMGRG